MWLNNSKAFHTTLFSRTKSEILGHQVTFSSIFILKEFWQVRTGIQYPEYIYYTEVFSCFIRYNCPSLAYVKFLFFPYFFRSDTHCIWRESLCFIFVNFLIYLCWFWYSHIWNKIFSRKSWGNNMKSMVSFPDWFLYMIRLSFQNSGTTLESCQK